MGQFYFYLPLKLASRLLIIIGFAFIVSINPSCTSISKSSAYFRSLPRDTAIAALVTEDYETKIQSKDILGIAVSSLNKEEDLIYNAAAVPAAINAQTSKDAAYLVDNEGNIQFHKLGKVKVMGLTKKQLQDKLETELIPYLKDPIVTVQYLNHKMTLLGELVRPQVLNLPEDRIPLLDALALSGDLTPNGRRDNIMIIREDGGERKIKRISLEDHSLLNSPWYYVKTNDIIYVSTDDAKIMKEEKRNRFAVVYSMVISSVSMLIIVLNSLLK